MRDLPRYRRPISDPDILERMRITFDLYDTSVAMMRQNLRRRNPDATEEMIEQGIRDWLAKRPGAEHGDCVGTPRKAQHHGQ